MNTRRVTALVALTVFSIGIANVSQIGAWVLPYVPGATAEEGGQVPDQIAQADQTASSTSTASQEPGAQPLQTLPSLTCSMSPSSVTLVQGGASQTVTFTVQNGSVPLPSGFHFRPIAFNGLQPLPGLFNAPAPDQFGANGTFQFIQQISAGSTAAGTYAIVMRGHLADGTPVNSPCGGPATVTSATSSSSSVSSTPAPVYAINVSATPTSITMNQGAGGQAMTFTVRNDSTVPLTRAMNFHMRPLTTFFNNLPPLPGLSNFQIPVDVLDPGQSFQFGVPFYIPPDFPVGTYAVVYQGYIGDTPVANYVGGGPLTVTGNAPMPPPADCRLTIQQARQAIDNGTLILNRNWLAGSASLTNNTNCSFPVTLTTYRILNDDFAQQLADSDFKDVVPHATTSFQVDNPNCAFQIDLRYGNTTERNPANLLGGQIFKDGRPLCGAQPNPTGSFEFIKTATLAADRINFTLTVRNNNAGGPLMPGATITDQLPAGLRFIAGSSQNCVSTNTTTVTCTTPDPLHQNGQSFTAQFAAIGIECGRTYANTASLSGRRGQPGGLAPFVNISLTSNTTVTTTPACPTPPPTPTPDLAGCIDAVGPGPLQPGQTGQATIRFRNASTGTTWTSATHGLRRADYPGTPLPGFSTDDFEGSVGPGGTAVFTFPVTAPVTPGTFVVVGELYNKQTGQKVGTDVCGFPLTVNQPPPSTTTASIVKTADQTVAQRGENVMYTLRVRNTGQAATAPDTYIDDYFHHSGALSFVSAAGCSIIQINADNVLRCQVGVLQPGAEKSFTATFRISDTAACNLDILNNAGVAGSNIPAAYTLPTHTRVNCPVQPPVVNVTKSGPASLTYGQGLTYTITVNNTGNGEATNVMVMDDYPNELQFVSATGANCSDNGNALTCQLGTIAAGMSKPVTLSFATPAPNPCVTRTIANKATVSVGNLQTLLPIMSNEVTTILNCPASPGLNISKQGPAEVTRGNSITYTLTVQNTGNTNLSNVLVRDPVPTAAGDLPFNAAASTPGCSRTGNDVQCGPVSLNVGETKFFTIVLNVPVVSYCTQANINNIAFARADNVSERPSNQIPTVIKCPDITNLSISKQGPGEVTRGNTFTYALRASNAGTVPATNVVVSDRLPDGVTFQSGGSAPTCRASGQQITCDPFTLNAGDHRDFTIVVSTPIVSYCTDTTVLNRGKLRADNFNEISSNNISTLIKCSPVTGLNISKTGPRSIIRGNTAIYTVRVFNSGTVQANNIRVTDLVPFGLTYNTGSSTNTCREASGLVTCDLFSLPAGQFKDFTITFNIPIVSYCSPASFTNIARMTADGVGDTASNGVLTNVTCPDIGNPQLSLSKSGPANIVRGNRLTYSFTIQNTGGNTANDVRIIDTIPQGLGFYLGTESTAGCNYEPQNGVPTVVCHLGNFNPGQTRNVSLVFDLPTVSNCAAFTIENVGIGRASNAPDVTSNRVTTAVQCPGGGGSITNTNNNSNSNTINPSFNNYVYTTPATYVYQEQPRVQPYVSVPFVQQPQVIAAVPVSQPVAVQHQSYRQYVMPQTGSYAGFYEPRDSGAGFLSPIAGATGAAAGGILTLMATTVAGFASAAGSRALRMFI